jgi:hypothetical protein
MLKLYTNADGKPIDPSSISVMTGTTYDQEFGFELEKLKVRLVAVASLNHLLYPWADY